jgi:hypothetical protein
MNETKIQPYFDGLFDIISMWTEKDVISKLSPSKDQAWLRFIVRKK